MVQKEKIREVRTFGDFNFYIVHGLASSQPKTGCHAVYFKPRSFYFPVDRFNFGFKFFADYDDFKVSVDNYKLIQEKDKTLVPQMGEYIYHYVYGYGYLIEDVEMADHIPYSFERIIKDHPKCEEFYMRCKAIGFGRDFHPGNFGILNDRFVLVDFGQESREY